MKTDVVKVLYIDDEEVNLINFNYLFQNTYEIFVALSAKEGLELINLHEF